MGWFYSSGKSSDSSDTCLAFLVFFLLYDLLNYNISFVIFLNSIQFQGVFYWILEMFKSLFLMSSDLLTIDESSFSFRSNLSENAAISFVNIIGFSSLKLYLDLYSITKTFSLFIALRRVEQKWFLTQLSVLPDNYSLIRAHLFPNLL